MQNGVPTSTLLRVLSVILLKPKCIVWDGADACPDWDKIMTMTMKMADLDRFAWNHIRLDRTNPEHWEYSGPS